MRRRMSRWRTRRSRGNKKLFFIFDLATAIHLLPINKGVYIAGLRNVSGVDFFLLELSYGWGGYLALLFSTFCPLFRSGGVPGSFYSSISICMCDLGVSGIVSSYRVFWGVLFAGNYDGVVGCMAFGFLIFFPSMSK